MKISTPTQPDKYDATNRPYRDFFKEVVAADPVANPKDHLVMGDEANMANIIRGKGVPTPPATNRGHFHIGHDEFWFILEGKCDYLIEDAGLFTADTGRCGVRAARPLPPRQLGQWPDRHAAVLQCEPASFPQFRRRRRRQAVSGDG